MSSKIFNHIKKVIIVLAIILMCTSHSAYAFSYKDNSNFIQSLIGRLFNIEQKETEEITQEESEQELQDDSRTGSFIKGLINKLFKLKPENQENSRTGFMSGVKNKLFNIGNNKNETKNKEETVVVTAQEKATTLNSSNDTLTSINLVGENRYDTTILVSKEVYPNGAENVILANATSNTDGILAVTLANKLAAPILLTTKDTLNKDIKAEIKRLSPKKVYLIGGTSTIFNSVENEVKNMNISTERISGSTRYTTATAIAEVVSNFDKIIVCNSKDDGKNVAAISAIAAENGMPILYNDSKSSINKDTFNFIKKYAENIKTIYMIGNVASEAQRNILSEYGISIEEISGSTQYDINAKMINKFSTQYNNVVLVNNSIDAISISYLAAKNKSLFLYTNTNLTTEQKNIVKNNEISKIYYSGGGTIKETVDELNKILKAKTEVEEINEPRVYIAQYYDPATGRVSSTKASNDDLGFWVYIPERTNTSKLPLIVFLHGTGEWGSNLNVLKNIQPFYLEQNDYEAVIIYPQCPYDTTWLSISEKIKGLIQYSIENYNVNENKVALTGFSWGGSGAWEIGLRYPTLFSCIVPVCGYSSVSASIYPDCPVWAIGSTGDGTYTYSQQIGQLLEDAGKKVKVSKHTAEHAGMQKSAYTSTLINWLIERSRTTNSSYEF